MAHVLRVGFLQFRLNRIQVRSGLRRSNTSFHTPQYLTDPSAAANVEQAFFIDLFLVNDRNEEVAGERWKSPDESRWRHSNDGERMSVEQNRLAHRAAIALQVILPVRVGN